MMDPQSSSDPHRKHHLLKKGSFLFVPEIFVELLQCAGHSVDPEATE